MSNLQAWNKKRKIKEESRDDFEVVILQGYSNLGKK
jgi:hypothetical protein